jgi:uncharacterized protein YcbK (DUF882 family)
MKTIDDLITDGRKSMSNYFSPDIDRMIDFDKIDHIALGMLNTAREIAEVPFIITSSYRTPEHSETVGGSRADAHTETPCTAFDIAASDAHCRMRIIKGLIAAGFGRIGVNVENNHIHVDHSNNLPPEVFWIES